MTHDTLTPTPVYIRIGERSEANVGTVNADDEGRVNPEELALFLSACAHQILSLNIANHAQWRTSKENASGE